MIYLELIFNLALLVALSIVSGFIEKRWPRDTGSGVLLQGFLFGIVAVIGMLNPLVLGPGLIFDGRSVMISLCALFFGPLAVSVTCVMTIACRVALGGPGTIMGVSVILASALIGLWAHYRFKPSIQPPSVRRLFALGLAVHVAMVALMFTLPGDTGWATFNRLGLPVILLYPIATILIGKILSDQVEAWRNIKALRESEEQYREVVEGSNSIILRMDARGVVTFINDYASRFLGFSKEEIIGRNVVGTIVPAIDSAGKDLAQMVLDLGVHPERYKNNENENICKDGTRVWVVWTNRAILDDQGQCVEILCIGNDFTERKRMEESLRESEEKYRSVFQNASIGIFHSLPEGRFLRVNPALAQMMGYASPQEMTSTITNISTQVYVDSKKHAGLLAASMENDGWVLAENHYRRKDGAMMTANLSLRKVLHSDGTIAYLEGFVEDITKRKQAEKALQEKNEELDRYFGSSLDLLCIADTDGHFIRLNPEWEKVLGYSIEDLEGRLFLDFVHPEDVESTLAAMAKLNAQEEVTSFENRYRGKDGSYRWIEWRSKPQGTMIYAAARDITERKQTEEALRESEEKFRVLSESTPTAVMLYQDDHWIYANHAAETICGYSEKELMAMNFWDIAHPKFKLGIQHEGRKRQEGKETINRHEFKIITKNGMEKWVDLSGASTRFRGRPAGILSILDITGRKQAEDDLKKSKEMLSLITENMSDMIRVADLQGNNLYASPSHFKGLGYRMEERVGKSSFDIVHPDDIEMIMNKLSDSLASRQPVRIEYRVRHADGHYVWLETVADLLRDAHGEPTSVVLSSRDVSDRKKTEDEKKILEERLNRAEKMEALGQLAGGVAHDLNNVLGAVSGYAELLLMEIPDGQRARRHAEMVFQSTQRGAAIIQDLLTLARRGVTVSDVINLNDVILTFLKAPVFDNIKDYHPRLTFKTELDKNLLNIKGSLVHLEKTLINLVSNAAESISGIGEVTIRTESRYLGKAIRGYDAINEGDYAILTVSDTGMGISAEDREKMFEPFYSKKKMGRSGTGLGLAIVWGTVKDLSGYIDVQTKVGEGSAFSLYFPVSREEMIAPKQKISIEQYMGKGESVLVIDDIAEQRDVASGLLTRLGYEVHAVSSGEEAVEYLRANKADILVLDMIMMPGMDGLSTYQMIMKINPMQKAILVSGFSETDRVREAQKLGAGAYVKKPYVLENIGVAIRDELSR